MNLQYYLLCKRQYEYNIREIDEQLLSENENHYLIPFLQEKRLSLKELLYKCELKIHQLCKHTYEDDVIDIACDRCMYITYCTICGYTKP